MGVCWGRSRLLVGLLLSLAALPAYAADKLISVDVALGDVSLNKVSFLIAADAGIYAKNGLDVHQFITPGAVVAAVIWIAVSGLFAVYTSMFGSYNKTWGSLSAVIVMLTWLWLTGLALLFAAEINAEAERSRELRRKEPAGGGLTAPAKG